MSMNFLDALKLSLKGYHSVDEPKLFLVQINTSHKDNVILDLKDFSKSDQVLINSIFDMHIHKNKKPASTIH